MIFLIIGGYFVFSKLQSLWPFHAPVTVKPNLSPTSTPTLYSQMYNTSSNNKFYIQTWSNTPTNSKAFEVYEINDGQLQKIFSKVEDQVEAVSFLGVTPEGLLIIKREYRYNLPTKLTLYNTSTQKSETLLELTPGHSLTASLSPDRNQVIFSDHYFFCEIECSPRNYIKKLDLANKTITTIYSDFTADTNNFYAPWDWTDSDTVILARLVEIGEGPLFFEKILALNIHSKQVKELPLDTYSRSISVKPNSAGIVYATFEYDFTKKTHNSALVLKSIDGTTKVLQNSSQLMYEAPVWLDSENIAVVTTTIQSIDEDCVYDICIEGKRTVQIISTKTGNTQNLALSAEPIDLGGTDAVLLGNKQNLYYLSETPNTYLLRRYDITNGEDKVIFESYQPINLFSIVYKLSGQMEQF